MSLTRVRSPLPDDLEALVASTISCCLTVTPGVRTRLSENVYTTPCCVEFELRSIAFEREKPIPVHYRGRFLCQQRVDILVDNRLVVEIKPVERIHPAHVAQTISDLRLTRTRVGLIVNFNVAMLKHGLRRVIL